LDEGQLAEDWAGLLNLASQPGASLEQLHVFCLAHVLRRPIIVYGVKYVKSWRGENLGFARFEGNFDALDENNKYTVVSVYGLSVYQDPLLLDSLSGQFFKGQFEPRGLGARTVLIPRPLGSNYTV